MEGITRTSSSGWRAGTGRRCSGTCWYLNADLLYIGLPGAVRLTVGMADHQTEVLALAANLTFCHRIHLLVLRTNRIKSRTRWGLAAKLHSE